MEEEKYMRRCIELAKNGLCNAAPNPMVGAVIVCDGRIIGEGYHIRCGEAHAEVNAIRSVKDESLLKRSTIYVSLEPCSHYGKTPPCADLIIEKQIPRIVIGCQDPFSQVAGRGIQKLKDAGREVIVGVLESECRQLIRRFITFNTLHRPYITLKWAESADHFIDLERTDGTGFPSVSCSSASVCSATPVVAPMKNISSPTASGAASTRHSPSKIKTTVISGHSEVTWAL